MTGPCLCGDTECPSCGSAQGTWSGPDPGEPACDGCGAVQGIDEAWPDAYLCPRCGKRLADRMVDWATQVWEQIGDDPKEGN